MGKRTKSGEVSKEKAAAQEYERLIALYRQAGVEDVKLQINDRLIEKVAEVYGILESIKNLPTIVYDKNNPRRQMETAAGKMRVKLLAQYSAAMQKLNKELIGDVDTGSDDPNFDDFEGE